MIDRKDIVKRAIGVQYPQGEIMENIRPFMPHPLQDKIFEIVQTYVRNHFNPSALDCLDTTNDTEKEDLYRGIYRLSMSGIPDSISRGALTEIVLEAIGQYCVINEFAPLEKGDNSRTYIDAKDRKHKFFIDSEKARLSVIYSIEEE